MQENTDRSEIFFQFDKSVMIDEMESNRKVMEGLFTV